MADELKGLLEKIQEEGVRQAEEKAAVVASQAESRAAGIVSRAQADAERLVAEARREIAKLEESSRQSLAQAARDMMLSLRKEIGATLDRLIALHVHRALTHEELAKVILGLVKGCAGDRPGQIVISLKKDEVEHIDKALLGELGAELRKGITLRSGADVRGGFLISFDGGKSCFDFTDRALVEYLAAHLKPQLAAIMKEAAPGKN